MVSPPLLLRGGRVLRSGSARPERLEIAIGMDGRIAHLGPRAEGPATAKVIDLKTSLSRPV